MDESVVKYLEPDQDVRIKCSTAMRIGAAIRPQTRGAFYAHGSSCAMGAALEGAGFPLLELGVSVYHDAIWTTLKMCFPEMYEPRHVSPVGGNHAHHSAHNIAVSLNNNYGWSREKIADWLEQEGL